MKEEIFPSVTTATVTSVITLTWLPSPWPPLRKAMAKKRDVTGMVTDIRGRNSFAQHL